MEEASACTVRLDPFAIQDELRDSSLAHVTDKLVRGAGSVLDVDLGIGDLVSFEEFLGFAAIAAPRSRIKPVSYTHLDVYKRQEEMSELFGVADASRQPWQHPR